MYDTVTIRDANRSRALDRPKWSRQVPSASGISELDQAVATVVRVSGELNATVAAAAAARAALGQLEADAREAGITEALDGTPAKSDLKQLEKARAAIVDADTRSTTLVEALGRAIDRLEVLLETNAASWADAAEPAEQAARDEYARSLEQTLELRDRWTEKLALRAWLASIVANRAGAGGYKPAAGFVADTSWHKLELQLRRDAGLDHSPDTLPERLEHLEREGSPVVPDGEAVTDDEGRGGVNPVNDAIRGRAG